MSGKRPVTKFNSQLSRARNTGAPSRSSAMALRCSSTNAFMAAGGAPLFQRAAATGKPIKGFETAPQQIGFIADMSEAAQLAMLRSGLKEFDQADAFLGRMVTAWATGDVEGLDALIGQEMRDESAEMYAVMLTRRNQDWADQIQVLLAGSGTAFISVGAGHLAGPDSLQTQLEQRGLRVEEVRD